MRRYSQKPTALEQRAIESQRRHDRRQVMKRNQKRRRRRRRLFVLLALLLLCAAGYGAYTLLRRTFLVAHFDHLPTIREEANRAALDELLPSDTTGRPLTQAEKTADARQLQALLKNIPSSLRSADADAVKVTLDNMVDRAAKTATDEEFFGVLQEMVKVAGTRQSSMLLPDTLANLRRNVGSGFYAADSPYTEALSDERVIARYARLRKAMPKKKTKAGTAFALPTLRIDTTTDTAILSGLAFEDGAYRTQKEDLARLMREARGHKYVLLDLRNTNGSSVEYWAEGLLPYLMTATYGVETRLFFPHGFENHVDYLAIKERIECLELEDEQQNVSNVQNEETRKAVKDMAYSKKLTITAKGNEDTPAPANLVLLVDKTTGGAAETFADFCRRLQNVELIGSKTAGTAWKIPAFPVKLLHSGYVALLDPVIALVPDEETMQAKTKVQPNIVTNAPNLLPFALEHLRKK